MINRPPTSIFDTDRLLITGRVGAGRGEGVKGGEIPTEGGKIQEGPQPGNAKQGKRDSLPSLPNRGEPNARQPGDVRRRQTRAAAVAAEPR